MGGRKSTGAAKATPRRRKVAAVDGAEAEDSLSNGAEPSVTEDQQSTADQTVEEVDEFNDADSEEELSEELEEFEADGAEEGEEEIDKVVALSAKDANSRSLEVRRAIEERMESRRLSEDLDYLDLDFDD